MRCKTELTLLGKMGKSKLGKLPFSGEKRSCFDTIRLLWMTIGNEYVNIIHSQTVLMVRKHIPVYLHI